MAPKSRPFFAGAALSSALAAACAAPSPRQPADPPRPAARIAIIESSPSVERPPFSFSKDDERLLDDIQRGAFGYLWETATPETGMVFDRSSVAIVSVAGVGFQLSSIPIGVERGWITRDEGEARARLILSSLSSNPTNRKAGLFYHYLDGATAAPSTAGYEAVVSTIDSALLFAGVVVASSYFDGDIRELGDRILADADWSFFIADENVRPFERGFVSLGWKPDDKTTPTGDGSLLPFVWVDSGDEHRLVTFLGVCAPDPDHRLDPALYYRLRRALGEHAGSGPFVWFPWSGALFTNFFAHCWIDYAHLGPDNPAAFGVERRARVDWWENSRRAVLMHRRKAVENPRRLPTFGPNAWGLTASDTPRGYRVPGLFPTPLPQPGDIPEFDASTATPTDDYGDGTIAPYAAGASILFDPTAALAALRHYRDLKTPDGSPLVWRDPGDGGYGFQDSFNLAGPWVARDCVAIDQGPLLLAIENARTGLVWDLFHAHPAVQSGMERLRLERRRGTDRERGEIPVRAP